MNSRYTDVLKSTNSSGEDCTVLTGKDESILKVNHPTTYREYARTNCVLGTVLQDQAYFTIRRKQAGFPELLNTSLDVNLVCGYVGSNPFTRNCLNSKDDDTAADCSFYFYTYNNGARERKNYVGCQTTSYISGIDKPAITGAVFNKQADGKQTCTITIDAEGEQDKEDQRQFVDIEANPRPYPITLYPNQDVVRFTVPRLSPFFNSIEPDPTDPEDKPRPGNEIRCTIDSVAYSDSSGSVAYVDGDTMTAIVEVSAYGLGDKETFHSKVSETMTDKSIPTTDTDRVNEMGAALFYTYVWGWYTGFIDMPYHSIQGLLSSPPFAVSGDVRELTDTALQNEEALQRYRLLVSLFADESDDQFTTDHFGFLTPEEAEQKYEDNHKKRFNAYFGRVLGAFLQELPQQYRQR